jgi:hypothetical protein
MPVGQAMQQPISQQGSQVLSPPDQCHSERAVEPSTVGSTSDFAESLAWPNSASNRSSISNSTPHLESLSCLPSVQKTRQTKHSHIAFHQLSNPPKNRSKKSHSERKRCFVCGKITRTARDTNRHIWTEHPQYAAENQIPSEVRDCPSPACEYHGRQDNVSRHFRRKHGGSLQWKGDEILVH